MKKNAENFEIGEDEPIIEVQSKASVFEVISYCENPTNCVVKGDKNKDVQVIDQISGAVIGLGKTNKDGIAIIMLDYYSYYLKAI